MGEARIPTNLRQILILEAVASGEGGMTPAEIGRRVGLPKQTIHRLCAGMVEEGLLARAPGDRGLRAGRRARTLAAGLLHQGVDVAARRQILTRLAAAVQETVNFAAPAEDGMVYVDRVETDWAFRIQLPIGAVVPFHCTASGKTYLASLAPAKRRKLIKALTMKARTPKSHLSAETLEAELDEVALRGYAIDDEELMEGMVAIAAPVTDPEGRFVAAIAFHGPMPRLNPDIALRQLPVLQAAAADLKAALFE